MSIPKKPITELNAAAAIMDGVFSMVDERWEQVWPSMYNLILETNLPTPKPEFAKFNFSLAVLAVNFRAVFDLVPREPAERMFTYMLVMLEKQFGPGQAFNAVRNALIKYIEAYNSGIIAIRNPLKDVSMLYYYKIGLKNTQQVIVDETYFMPDPRTVDYMSRAFAMFMGRWEFLLERYEIMFKNDDVQNVSEPPSDT